MRRAIQRAVVDRLLPSHFSNVAFNRWLWNRYARRWNAKNPPLMRVGIGARQAAKRFRWSASAAAVADAYRATLRAYGTFPN
jgi:hypothetical protein